jgi:hypothetical protein
MARLENLKAELTDIDWMDRFYWQTKNPEQHEKLGYLVRQVRRRDVIAELLKLMQEAVKRERPRISGARPNEVRAAAGLQAHQKR